MGRNVLFKRCVKRVTAGILTQYRIRDFSRQVVLLLIGGRRFGPQSNVDYERDEH